MEIRVSEGCIGFWLELWGALPDAFNLSIRTPGGETIPELRLGLQQSVTYSFIYEKAESLSTLLLWKKIPVKN